MKKIIIFTVITMFFLLPSCSDDSETIMNQNETIQNQLNFLDRKSIYPKAPVWIGTPTGCGYGFNMFIAYITSPNTPAFGVSLYYEIETMTGAVVDSGYVSHGINTNWVLSPCTTYKVKIWGWGGNSTTWPNGNNPPIIATTDGCGNVFIC